MAKGVCEREPRPKLSAIDAIQTGTRHLQQAQTRPRRGHRFAEAHGDENLGIAKLVEDSRLIAGDDLAVDAEPAADRLGQPHGKRSRKSSFHAAFVPSALGGAYR